MARKVKKSEVNFTGKAASIGIDMHKRSWHITALVGGTGVLGITLANPPDIRAIVDRLIIFP